MKKLILSMVLTAAAVLSLVIVTSVGCGSPDQLGPGNRGGAAGAPIYNLDANPGGSSAGGGNAGNGGPLPTADANCGSQTNSTTKQPADVLLVLDRSGSMGDDIAEDCKCLSTGNSSSRPCADLNACTDRWSTVSSAINATVSSTPDIHWGLKLFSTPGGSSCNVSNRVEVAIGPDSASGIQEQIASTSPQNNTPTAQAIKAAVGYLNGVSDPGNKVILLATDGQPNCASGGSSTPNVDATIAEIAAAKEAGYQVYVIGIGPSVGNLNNFAQAGGTGEYFPATSPQQLADALAQISSVVASCSFTLAKPPTGADLTNVAVYLDKNLVKQDADNGWSFGANSQTIVLNGDTCEKVKSGQATNVQVVFGCETPLPVIP
jgi:hypothetical protein